MKSQVDADGGGEPVPITVLSFCRRMGVSAVTAWRWEKRGWLKTMNIAGRRYISARALAEFNRRSEAGEFAQPHKTPSAQ